MSAIADVNWVYMFFIVLECHSYIVSVIFAFECVICHGCVERYRMRCCIVSRGCTCAGVFTLIWCVLHFFSYHILCCFARDDFVTVPRVWGVESVRVSRVWGCRECERVTGI